MDYNVYYDELMSEVDRTTVMLKGYNDVEPHFSDVVGNKATYQSYVLSSLPIGISDIVYILTSGNMAIKFDYELHNTLKNNTRLSYTKGLYEVMLNNKPKVVDIFKTLASISSNDSLINLKNGIVSDLNKNESRLARLLQLMKK